MGKVGRVIAGIGLIVTGAVIGIFTGQWQLAFAVASLGAGLLLQPKMPDLGSLNDRTGAILENRVGSLQSLPVVYGTVKIAGVFADIRVHAASTERKRLVLVSAFCHGSRDGTGITAIDEVWFDDRKAVDVATVQTPFSSIVPGQTPAIKYLEFEHHLGDSSTQIVDTRLAALFPAEWPVTSRGRGVCYSRFELWYNADTYPGGIPTIQVKMRGNKVHDPRDGTWKFSTNPALCIRDYILSAIYGLGISEANLDSQSFIDMANHCDELVNIPGGGTQKRYELSGWIDTSRPVEQNLAEMCTSCRAQVVNEGDTWRMIIRRARPVSGFKITEKNTVEGAWQFILPGADLCPNVVRASYIDPSRNYTVDTVQWPEPGQPNPFFLDDNSYEQRLEMDLPFTDNRIRAQQIGMTLMKESREAIGVVCTLKEEGALCRVGELVEVTYSTPGWQDKVFDVAALMLSPDGQVRAVLIEYEPTVYDLDVQFPQAAAPNTSLPNPFAITAPTALVLVSVGQELLQSDGGYIPRIRVTWTKANDPFVDYYQIQARRAVGDTIEVLAPFTSANFTHSGLTAFFAALIWNDNVGAENAWHTDSAVSGAWLQLDCGIGITKEYVEACIYVTSASAGVYDIEYSDNGSSWSLASAAFRPSVAGLNSRKWVSVGSHRYWRIRLTNTPGAGPWHNELQFLEGAWDDFGRVSGLSEPLVYVYPVTADESWAVRVRAVNQIGVSSAWLSGTHIPVVLDPRPQVLSITLTNAHSDIGHIDSHTDVAHTDAGHSDTHTDSAHTDHTDHSDSHSDSHTDSGHGDSHTDFHADHSDGGTHVDIGHYDTPHVDHTDGHGDSHTDGHSDSDHTDTAHVDYHSDHTDGAHSDIGHYDVSHTDHIDTAVSHSDIAHVDNHSDVSHADTAHSDGHTDQTHGDGQFGVGIAIQADQDSASVKAVARKVSGNKLLNGGGETGTVGSQATSWTFGAGNALNVANDFSKYGSKSLKIINSSAANSYSSQDVAVVSGKRYRVEAWIKTSALPSADAGFGAIMNLDIVSGVSAFTVVEKLTIGTDPTPAQPDIGIQADGIVHDWTYVFCRFIPTGSGTLRIYSQLGYGGTQSGTAWWDGVGFFEDEPSALDVRTQSAVDGRNVVIELIDMATGAQIQLAPGDMVRVGALAYSDAGGTGQEGPLALASVGLFNIAPVGTDQWVPG